MNMITPYNHRSEIEGSFDSESEEILLCFPYDLDKERLMDWEMSSVLSLYALEGIVHEPKFYLVTHDDVSEVADLAGLPKEEILRQEDRSKPIGIVHGVIAYDKEPLASNGDRDKKISCIAQFCLKECESTIRHNFLEPY
jgi:hypothetical protein